jgi:hypothetical protein
LPVASARYLFPVVEVGADLTLPPWRNLAAVEGHVTSMAPSPAQTPVPLTILRPATVAQATRPLLPSNPHTHPAAAVAVARVRLRTAAQVVRAVTMARAVAVVVRAMAVLSAATAALAALAS